MRIKKLKLKNWAGFAEREFDLDGSVVILVGKNGGGKTTLMNSITYSLQGKLPNKAIASDFIRNFGIKGGATSAEISAEFFQSGQDFQVWRKLDPKGSERKLTLSTGTEFKYAEQVDEQIGALLGTDVDTVSNVMFIPQGDLKNILFGTASDQEKLLIKILDIGYLQDVYEALAAKISTLSVGIDPTLDTRIVENSSLIETLNAALANDKKELEEKVIVTDTQVSEIEANLVLLENIDRDMRTGEREAINLSEELTLFHSRNNIDLIKSKLATAKSDSGKEEEIAKLRADLDNLKSKKAFIESLISALHKYETTNNEFKLDHALFSSMQQINLGSRSPSSVKFVINNIADISNIGSFRDKLEVLKKELNTNGELLTTKKELLLITKTKSNGYKFFLHAQDDGVVCSTCQSTVTAENVKKGKESLVAFTQQEHLLSTDVARLEFTISYLQKEHNSVFARLRELEEAYTMFGDDTIRAIIANPSILDFAKYQLLVTKNNELVNLNKFIETNSLVVKTTYGLNDTTLAGLSTEIGNTIRTIEATAGRIQELEQNIRASVSREELDRLDTYNAKDKILKETEKNNEFLKQKVISQEVVLAELFDRLPLDTSTAPQFRDRLSIIKTHASELRDLTDSLKLISFRIEEACTEKLKLLKTRKDNQVKIDLINDLSMLKDSFSRKGFASKFIQAKFEQLIAVTKENLNKLSVQFEIDQDPGKPLSFLFKRHDNGNDNWLPQKLMSGGQRVRLCLAFIMAIQQVLVPNLGFLLLDEPSNHMDETGADDLRDFLIRIRPELEAKNMQLIVCDHNKSITSAQTKFIEL